jgi:hypothetical protein
MTPGVPIAGIVKAVEAIGNEQLVQGRGAIARMADHEILDRLPLTLGGEHEMKPHPGADHAKGDVVDIGAAFGHVIIL